MMPMQEIEARFYVENIQAIRTRLHQLEARLIQDQTLETSKNEPISILPA